MGLFDDIGSGAATADLSSIAENILDDAPEPQPHAIEQSLREESGAGGVFESAELDANGIPWNPSEHATGIGGKGVKTQKGVWKKKRNVRASGSILRTPGATSPESDSSAEPAGPSHSELQARAAGAMAGTMLVRMGMMIGGEEFAPRMLGLAGRTISEETMLQDAFGTYFVAKNYTDIPPGVVLSFTILGYIGPRLGMPKTKERVGGFFSWIKAKFVSWRLRRHGLRAVPNQERASQSGRE